MSSNIQNNILIIIMRKTQVYLHRSPYKYLVCHFVKVRYKYFKRCDYFIAGLLMNSKSQY